MVLLRQVSIPGSQASWTEHLYDREYKIVNGEVEVENPTHVGILLGRGYKEISEEEQTNPQPVQVLGVLRRTEEDVQVKKKVGEEKEAPSDAVSSEPEPQNTEETNEETATPLTLEETLAEAKDVVEEQPKKRGRGRPRKATQGA